MGFLILVRWHLYIDSAPRLFSNKINLKWQQIMLQRLSSVQRYIDDIWSPSVHNWWLHITLLPWKKCMLPGFTYQLHQKNRNEFQMWPIILCFNHFNKMWRPKYILLCKWTMVLLVTHVIYFSNFNITLRKWCRDTFKMWNISIHTTTKSSACLHPIIFQVYLSEHPCVGFIILLFSCPHSRAITQLQ